MRKYLFIGLLFSFSLFAADDGIPPPETLAQRMEKLERQLIVVSILKLEDPQERKETLLKTIALLGNKSHQAELTEMKKRIETLNVDFKSRKEAETFFGDTVGFASRLGGFFSENAQIKKANLATRIRTLKNAMIKMGLYIKAKKYEDKTAKAPVPKLIEFFEAQENIWWDVILRKDRQERDAAFLHSFK